ncbi:MAG: hypothetical protein R6X13_07825 [bacterium]
MNTTGRGGSTSRPCLLLALALLLAACPESVPTTPELPLGPDSLAMSAPGRFGFYSLPANPERDRYLVDWSGGGLDTTDEFRAGETLWLEHAWPDTGRRGVRCLALRDDGEASAWSGTREVRVYNRAPTVPALFAPDTAYAARPALCGALATDPEGDRIVYAFEWGDGEQTTTARYASGDTCRQYHTWAAPGTLLVRVRARDDYGNWSAGSPSRAVLVLP